MKAVRSVQDTGSRKSRGREEGSGLADLSSGVLSVCFRDCPVAAGENRKRGPCRLKEKMLLWGWAGMGLAEGGRTRRTTGCG